MVINLYIDFNYFQQNVDYVNYTIILVTECKMTFILEVARPSSANEKCDALYAFFLFTKNVNLPID